MAENPKPTLIHMLTVCYLLSQREFSIIDYHATDKDFNLNSLLKELEDPT